MINYLLAWALALGLGISVEEKVMLFFSFLGLFVFSIGVFNVFIYPFYFSPLRRLPGPTDNTFVLGQITKFLEVAWLPDLFCHWSRQWPTAPFVRYLNIANSETLIVNNIVAYREVLQGKSASFIKPAFASRFAWEIIGHGLPFVEGHLHKLRRAVLMRPFSTPRLRTFLPLIQYKAREFVDALKEERTALGKVEVETPTWKAVLDVIGMEIFDIDLNHLQSNESPLFDCFSSTMRQSTFSHIINFFNCMFPIRRFLPIKECRDLELKVAKARECIRGHVYTRRMAIISGEDTGHIVPDGLQYMLEHWDSRWGDDEIVEYAIHELSRRHDDQDRIREEVYCLYQRSPEPSYNEIEKLPFLNNFVREVLRMYCAVALAPRETIRDVEIAGIFIPKGTVLQLCPAVMNLHPLIWGEDATTFNADRWDNLTGDASSAFAFETFHNGPRMCIGKQLSIIEMKVFLMELISRFAIDSIHDGADVEIASPTFTLKTKEKLVVRLAEL